jgi:hypothetical protein
MSGATRKLRNCLLLAGCAVAHNGFAGPFIEVGNMELRHDITILADQGIISAPITTWPISWSSIAEDVDNATIEPDTSETVIRSLLRLKRHLHRELRQKELRLSTRIAGDSRDKAFPDLRTFDSLTREKAELTAGVEWMGENTAIKLNATYAKDPEDGKEYRADGSYAGFMAGGWSYSLSTMDRWWGPGYEGSLILSNNARPVPAISIQRMSAKPFETKWLSWLGPWQLKFFAGLMESERYVPHPKLFGLRINFKPFDSLEVGLSRTAQWGGEGRPEDFRTFVNMVLGKDNYIEEGITIAQEPGNQLAGWDLRWKPGTSLPLALYMQRIGEDQAGIYPTANMYQFGAETWGGFETYDYRLIVEYSDTVAYRWPDRNWNVAYNHHIYKDGYRYYHRSIGHSIDGDSAMKSIRFSLYGEDNIHWQFILSDGTINRDNAGLNAVSLDALDFTKSQISRRQSFLGGELDVALAHVSVKNRQTGIADDDTQVGMQWRRTF